MTVPAWKRTGSNIHAQGAERSLAFHSDFREQLSLDLSVEHSPLLFTILLVLQRDSSTRRRFEVRRTPMKSCVPSLALIAPVRSARAGSGPNRVTGGIFSLGPHTDLTGDSPGMPARSRSMCKYLFSSAFSEPLLRDAECDLENFNSRKLLHNDIMARSVDFS